MSASPTILCFGELLIDMIATTTGDLTSADGFLKKFGGAPANTSIGLAKLGLPVRFMGKVGDDPFGRFLKNTLDEYHVNTDSLILSKRDKTTLAFVALNEDGQRDFTFYIGAHETISTSEVSLPENTAVFHFGSLTQTNSTTHSATDKLIQQARKQGTILSYDPNVRESLWGNMRHARDIILSTAKYVDILKINETEALLLSNKKTLEEALQTLYTPNLDALLITVGKEGCMYKTKHAEGKASAYDVTPIDTTGAGDAFNAGFIYSLYTKQKKFSEMTQDELQECFVKATTIASLTTTKKGAITAFPDKAAIASALSKR